MVRKILTYIAITVLAVAFTSCRHKDLCLLHPHTAPIRINVDWSKFIDKEEPSGMTVIVYPQDGSAPVFTRSNDLSHVLVYLPAGMYNSIVFNQSENEFGSLELRNLNNYTKAEVATIQAPTRWYTTRVENEKVVHEPEWFGTDKEENAEVTKQMIEWVQHSFMESTQSNNGTKTTKSGIDLIYHTVENVIYTLDVKVHMKNIYNLRSARSAISGMAEGYLLAAQTRSNKTVTHLMEQWSLNAAPHDPTLGTIQTKIMCFGLPDNHGKTPQENTLTLSLLLVDGKTILNYTFNVGDLIREGDLDGELTLHLELAIDEPLPDVEPVDGDAGGFEATVDDWGEEIEHSIIM